VYNVEAASSSTKMYIKIPVEIVELRLIIRMEEQRYYKIVLATTCMAM